MPLVAIIFQTLKNRAILLAYTTEIFSMDSNLCRYNLYADNRGDSLETTRQTTVGAILVDSHASVAM